MKRYNPVTVFPLFVMIIVTAGVLYTIDSKSKFSNQSLAQVHISEPEPEIITSQSAKPNEQILAYPLNELQFPDTTVIAAASSSARLESLQDTITVTDWYKQKMQNLGYSTTSSINANSNGNIENRLVGTKNNEELYIEIKKPNGFMKTAVNIEISHTK